MRHVHLGAEGLEAGRVQVEAARADRVATRDGDVGLADAGHERAEHRDGGAQRPDELVVGPVADALGHVEDDDARGRVVVDAHPEPAQQLGHDRHVGDRRHVRQSRAAHGQQGHGHQLQGAVLGADDGDLAHEVGATDDTESLSHPPNPIGAPTHRRRLHDG